MMIYFVILCCCLVDGDIVSSRSADRSIDRSGRETFNQSRCTHPRPVVPLLLLVDRFSYVCHNCNRSLFQQANGEVAAPVLTATTTLRTERTKRPDSKPAAASSSSSSSKKSSSLFRRKKRSETKTMVKAYVMVVLPCDNDDDNAISTRWQSAEH
jgi:uncharacterized Zn finger protein (UPF0148 family)